MLVGRHNNNNNNNKSHTLELKVMLLLLDEKMMWARVAVVYLVAPIAHVKD
jgi:hypothetical protein